MATTITNGARLMTTPTEWSWSIPTQAIFAPLFAYMASMNMALRWLIYGMICHMLTTIILVCRVPGKRVAADIKTDALVKAVALLVVWLLGKEPMFQLELMGQSVSVGALVAGYFLCGEWLSVAIDMDDLKMPFPPWVKSALQKAKEKIGDADIGSKIVSKYTSISQQSDGSVQTVQNATTIVTTAAKIEPEAPIA